MQQEAVARKLMTHGSLASSFMVSNIGAVPLASTARIDVDGTCYPCCHAVFIHVLHTDFLSWWWFADGAVVCRACRAAYCACLLVFVSGTPS